MKKPTKTKHKMTLGADAEVTPEQHEKPCHDCPWRRASMPGWLGSLSADEWIALAHSEGKADCHALKGPTEAHQCAGLATYRRNVCKSVHDPKALVLPADRERVFSSPKEFKEHHES